MSEEDNKQETTTEESTRPEHISEKFWNQDTGEVNVESLSTSYNALEKKLGQRTDELTKQIRTEMEQEHNAKKEARMMASIPRM